MHDVTFSAGLAARVTGAFLRTTKLVSRRFQGGPHMNALIAATRRAPVPLPTAKMKERLSVQEEVFNGRSIWTMAPRDRAPAGHLLFFHGGGYVFSSVGPHWDFYAGLAERRGFAVTAPLYPLAPESGAAETTAWTLAAYRHFLERHDEPFVMGGDSAGAGLAAATALMARDAGLRLPDGMLLICPWLDVSGSHPEQSAIEPRDSILRLRGIQDAGRLYARDMALDDPRISPLYGDWSGLPPVLMFGGADDILVTDARALKAKLPSTSYHEGAGLMHDWPLFFFEESKAARRAMAHFIADPSAASAGPLQP